MDCAIGKILVDLVAEVSTLFMVCPSHSTGTRIDAIAQINSGDRGKKDVYEHGVYCRY